MIWLATALISATVVGGATYEGVREKHHADVYYSYDPDYYSLEK